MTVQLLTLRQAADALGCSYSFVYRAHKRGVLPVVREGRFVRVSESDLVLWIDARRIAATIIAATEDKRAARDERQKASGLLVADDLREPTPST